LKLAYTLVEIFFTLGLTNLTIIFMVIAHSGKVRGMLGK